MSKLIDVGIRLGVTQTGAEQIRALNQDLAATGAAGHTAAGGLGEAGETDEMVGQSAQRTSAAMAGTAQGLQKTGNQAHETSFKFTELNQALELAAKVRSFADQAKDLIKVAESIENLNARLRAVLPVSFSLAEAQGQIAEIANRSHVPLKDVGDLYAQIATSAKNLNLSQQQVADITETVNKSLQISGASGEGAADALRQFAQSLAKGVVQAEEFNSVNEQAPYLISKIAEGLGIQQSALKGMVDAQQIGASEFAQAILKIKGSVDDAFKEMPLNVTRATTDLKNVFSSLVADFDNTYQITRTLGEGIEWFAGLLGDAKDNLHRFTDTSDSLTASLEKQKTGLEKLSRTALNDYLVNAQRTRDLLIEELANLDAKKESLLEVANSEHYSAKIRAEAARQASEVDAQIQKNLTQLGIAEEAAAAAGNRLTKSQQQAGNAADTAGESYVALSSRMGIAQNAIEIYTHLQDAEIKAQESALQVKSELLKSLGLEDSALLANAQAAQKAAENARIQADANQNMLAIEEGRIAAALKAHALNPQQERDLQNKIVGLRAEVISSQSAADMAAQHAKQANIEAQALSLTAQQVEELRQKLLSKKGVDDQQLDQLRLYEIANKQAIELSKQKGGAIDAENTAAIASLRTKQQQEGIDYALMGLNPPMIAGIQGQIDALKLQTKALQDRIQNRINEEQTELNGLAVLKSVKDSRNEDTRLIQAQITTLQAKIGTDKQEQIQLQQTAKAQEYVSQMATIQAARQRDLAEANQLAVASFAPADAAYRQSIEDLRSGVDTIKDSSADIAKWMHDVFNAALEDLTSVSKSAAGAVKNLMASAHDMASWNAAINGIQGLTKSAQEFIDTDSTAVQKLRDDMGDLQSHLANVNSEIESLNHLMIEDASVGWSKFHELIRNIDEMTAATLKAKIEQKELDIAGQQMKDSLDSLGKEYQDNTLSAAAYEQQLETLQLRYHYIGQERLQPLIDSLEAVKQKTEEATNTAKDALDSWRQKLDEIRGDTLGSATIQMEDDIASIQKNLDDARKSGVADTVRYWQQALTTAQQYWAENLAKLRADQSAQAAQQQQSAADTAAHEIAMDNTVSANRLKNLQAQGGPLSAIQAHLDGINAAHERQITLLGQIADGYQRGANQLTGQVQATNKLLELWGGPLSAAQAQADFNQSTPTSNQPSRELGG